MLVKEYNNPRSFLDDYETVMLEQEAISQLVLYSAYHGCRNKANENEKADDKADDKADEKSYEKADEKADEKSDDKENDNKLSSVGTKPDQKSDSRVIYGAVLDDDTLTLLFCNAIPYNLAIYAVKQDNIIQASTALADYMGSNHIVINGIYAIQDVCQSFMEGYKKHMKCSFSERLSIDIMELREVNEITPIEGVHRPARPSEAKLVAEWMIDFQMESLASEMDYEAALERTVKLIDEKKIFFYENKEQKVVTMAVAARKLANGTAITYIFTPEECRGKGYAAANIYYMSKELLEQGNQFCTLFVDKKNLLSSRAYEKVGFKSVGDIYEYKVIPIES